jgi:hypothetical protein
LIELPFDLKLEYSLHLARFLIQTIDHSLFGGQPERQPRFLVSPGEGLDALIYLVDRYCHVQLDIDPRINIREHLGQGYYAEVERYMTQPFYRDHLLHVIDVFLTGHLLLETRFTWINGKKQELLKHLPHLFKGESGKCVPGNLPEEWQRNWAMAALFHDIGYQLGDKEYQAMGLCETDIYTHFIQEVRELPELSIVAPVSRHSGGLFVREPNNKDWPFADHASQGRLSPLKRKGLMNLMDRIGIVVAGSADNRNRVGWLDLDPSELFKPFIKFKEKLFLERKQQIVESFTN